MKRNSTGASRPRLTIRIDFADDARLGPGKIALLEAIGRERSISAAARALGMSYRRAWLLVDSLNRMFRDPAVRTYPGRARGSGAELTRLGLRVVATYRQLEHRTAHLARPALRSLRSTLRARSVKRRS